MTAVSTRTAIVVDRRLPIGYAANAAAVVALSLGACRPTLQGQELVDAFGARHPGLFPAGLPVLSGSTREITRARESAAGYGDVLVVAMPAVGQTTNDYEHVRAVVAGTAPQDLEYAGIGLHGPEDVVRGLTRRFSLLR